MPLTAGSSRQYFLGIAGQQLGPFGEEQVAERIRQGIVPDDALIWYEGLTDWAPVATIEYFKEPLAEAAKNRVGATGPTPSQPAEKKPKPAAAVKPSLPTKIKATVPRAPAPKTTADPNPFGGSQNFGLDETDWFSSRNLIFGILGLVFVGGALILLWSGSDSPPDSETPVPDIAAEARSARLRALGKAQSELLLQPELSVAALRSLVNEKADDAVGKEALAALTNYYKQKGMVVEAAHLFMAIKRPDEAVPYLLGQPGFAKEAETALFAAYQAEKDPQKRRDFLLQDIRQWLGPLNERAKGIERIRQLQNEFPTQPNPFAYYLKTPDQKVVALFNRLSPVFVQGLLGFLDMEFPDLKTVKRPMVELKKDGSGRYRIVGNYLGNVNLRMDRLSDISFTFWLADEQWYVVATNITPERKKYASEVKARIKDKIYTADEMLIYLEGIFTREFPKSPLHESAGVSETAPPKSTKSD